MRNDIGLIAKMMKRINDDYGETKKEKEEDEQVEIYSIEDVLDDVRNELLKIIMCEDASSETIDMAIRVYNKIASGREIIDDFWYEDIRRSHVNGTTIPQRELIKISLHEYRALLPCYRFGVYGRNGNTKPVHNPKRSHVWVDPRTWIMIDACHVRRTRKRKKNDE